MGKSRSDLARELYSAFAAGDRGVVERLLSKDFRFSAPPDPLLDRVATSSDVGPVRAQISCSISSVSWKQAMR